MLRFVCTIIPSVFFVLDAVVSTKEKRHSVQIIGLVTVRGNPTNIRRLKVRDDNRNSTISFKFHYAPPSFCITIVHLLLLQSTRFDYDYGIVAIEVNMTQGEPTKSSFYLAHTDISLNAHWA